MNFHVVDHAGALALIRRKHGYKTSDTSASCPRFCNMLLGFKQPAQVRTQRRHQIQSPQIMRRLDPLFSARLRSRRMLPFDDPWNGWTTNHKKRLIRQMRLRAITSAADDGW